MALLDVIVPWPAPTLPGVCVKTGLPTHTGVVLPVGGSEDVVIPLSEAAQLRLRALRRIGVAAATVLVACLAGSFAVGPLLAGVVVGAGLVGWIGRELWLATPRVRRRGDALVIASTHPAFAAAVTSASKAGSCGGACLGCAARVF